MRNNKRGGIAVPQTAQKRYRFRRKYIIDPPLQAKMISFFVFLSLGNLAIFLFLVRLTINHFIDHLPLFSQSSDTLMTGAILQSGQWLIKAYIISALISFFYSVGIGILFTHSIAGPLFATRRFVNALIANESPQPLRLRKTDFMLDFAEDLNHLVKKYRPELYSNSDPSADPAQEELS